MHITHTEQAEFCWLSLDVATMAVADYHTRCSKVEHNAAYL